MVILLILRFCFNILKNVSIPVVWTFHDCWSFTGHCAYFDYVGCDKWKTACHHCEQKKEYPASFVFDRSQHNFIDKKRIFNSVEDITIVPVSHWLSGKVKESFLKNFPSRVIQNGIDLSTFYPKGSRDTIERLYNVTGKFIILGVASTWEKERDSKSLLN